MADELSDDEVKRRFRERAGRQFLVPAVAFPSFMLWFVAAYAAFGALVASSPSLNSPLVFGGLMVPFLIVFVVLATRFTKKNLRCPACDHAIRLIGTRYYRRGFRCPRCGRTLS